MLSRLPAFTCTVPLLVNPVLLGVIVRLTAWLARMVPLLTIPMRPLPRAPEPSTVSPLLVSTSVPVTPSNMFCGALESATVPFPVSVVLPLIYRYVFVPVELTWTEPLLVTVPSSVVVLPFEI